MITPDTAVKPSEDQVVEKQDMEKLEKEEETAVDNVEVKVEKRGRFNIKSEQSQESPSDPPAAATDDNTEVKANTPEVEVVEETVTNAQNDEVKENEDKKDNVSEEKPEETDPKVEPEQKLETAADETKSDDKKEEGDDDKEDDITQSEEEEPKQAVDSSPDGGRYLKFDEEIGHGSFKTVYKGEI